jgi:uncharacterized membrane protein
MPHRAFMFNSRRFSVNEIVPMSAIYDCSVCRNGTAFKKGEVFTKCENCTVKLDSQHWIRTPELVHFVSKNLNVEFKKIETFGLKLADFIADYSGRISFVVIHVIWFGFWIYVNTHHPLFGIPEFDPYPFGLLTMIVSLEAIFLATFILISQNRQGAKSELRAELDYQVNLKTEKEVAELESLLRDIREEGKRIEENTRVLLADFLEKVDERGIRPKPKKTKRKKQTTETILADAGIEKIKEE